MIKQKMAERILTFTGHIGVVIPIQIAQSCCDGILDWAVEALDDVVRHYGWLGRIRDRKIPRRCGGNDKSDKIDIYHVTPMGIEHLREISPKIAAGTRYINKPTLGQMDFVFHDLMVNKAIIWLERHHKILEFMSEKRIRAKLFSQRIKEGKNIEPELQQNTMADFIVKYQENFRDEVKVAQCEVSLSLDCEQIRRKPPGMMWFVNDSAHADIIEHYGKAKRQDIITLGDLNCHKFADDEEGKLLNERMRRMEAGILRPLTRAEETILKGMQKLDGMGTPGAISSLLNRDRANVNRQMKDMEREGWLSSEGVHLEPGIETGARKKIFWISNIKKPSLTMRQIALTRSLLIQNLADKDYFFVSLDGATLRVDHRIRNERLIFVIGHFYNKGWLESLYMNYKKLDTFPKTYFVVPSTPLATGIRKWNSDIGQRVMSIQEFIG